MRAVIRSATIAFSAPRAASRIRLGGVRERLRDVERCEWRAAEDAGEEPSSVGGIGGLKASRPQGAGDGDSAGVIREPPRMGDNAIVPSRNRWNSRLSCTSSARSASSATHSSSRSRRCRLNSLSVGGGEGLGGLMTV